MTAADERKANARRQREWRARINAAGYKILNVWCHPDDAERLKRYAERLRKHRDKQQP